MNIDPEHTIGDTYDPESHQSITHGDLASQSSDETLTKTPSLVEAEKKETSTWLRVLDVILDELHPMHFVITMGIGITSGILYNFPVLSIRKGSRYVGIVYFFINLIAFIVIHTLFFLKYTLICRRYRTSLGSILRDHNLSVFLGCEVMGFSTIINMVYMMKPEWYMFTYVLWWCNVMLSLMAGWGITFIMIGMNRIEEESINATILLPTVTMTVVSSTGSLIGQSLAASPSWQFSTIIITFLLWANAMVLAFFLFALYLNRLIKHGLPSHSLIYTCFIPIGVLGQGGWAIQLNYQNLGNLIVNHHGLSFFDEELATEYLRILQVFLRISAIAIALVLASFGICLTVISIVAVVYCGKPPVWTRSMWASTFPLGTMALSFNEMASTTHNMGFKIVGTIYSVMVILITTYSISGTLIFEIPFKRICQAFH